MNNTEREAAIDEVLKRANPCGITIVDGKTRCNGKANGYTPCCQGCKHLSGAGCAFKGGTPVMCRMYLCAWAWDKLNDEDKQKMKDAVFGWEGELKFRGDGYHVVPHEGYPLNHVPFR